MPAETRQLRILHLEDGAEDVELVQFTLAHAGLAAKVRVARTRDAYLTALADGAYDVILSDSGVPGFDGLAALETARRIGLTAPFIYVSGGFTKDRIRTLDARTDCSYVPKAELERLPDVIEQALAEAEARKASPRTSGYREAAEYLVAVVQELSHARHISTIMEIVRHAARELTGADGATFVLRDGNLCHYADENAIAPLWKGKRFPMESCISGWAMLNKQPAVIADIFVDPRIPVDAYRPTFVKSLAMVPIRTSAPVGAIGNYWASRHQATPDEVRLLQALADSTSIAMENVQLYNELEKRVADRTRQLEEANRELESFSYSVSHDLSAPLRAIEGFSQFLEKKSASSLDENGRTYVQHIRRATARMGQLLDDLLKLSRIVRADLAPETVNLSQMAREICAALQAEQPERSVQLDIADGIMAQGDARLLRVALENLLSNAWKYTGKKAAARIVVGEMTSTKKEQVYFVRDNGAGFNMQYAAKLFGAFQRLHGEEEFPGNGVGLATVQRVIQKHGGRIWAEAAENEGATFFFTLG